jgi:exodeoxyribonuclease VII small subunit
MKKATFEQNMQRLEEIVRDLETNEKPLDESIKLFEEGLLLVKSCDEKLKEFENKVSELVKNNGETENEL